MDDDERMAKAALAEMPVEGAVLLDSGAVLTRFAEAVPAGQELTVLTHSAAMAAALSARPGLTVMVLGGRLHRHTLTTTDDWALRMLREMFVDVAFLVAGGVSTCGGLTTSDGADAVFKRTAVAAARRVVILADHEAVGVDQAVAFGSLDEVDTIITNDRDPVTARQIGAAGPRVVVA